MAGRTRKTDRLRGGQLLEVTIVRLAPTGDGIAEQPGGVEVHVPGALPGERVAARITHVSRQVPRAHASLDRVIQPSRARRRPPCRHHGECTGCPLMIADGAAQRRYKRALLQDAYGLDVKPLTHDRATELGYRWSSKRVVGGSQNAVVLGSFRRRTHELGSMRGCLVDHPLIAACARELEDAANRLGLVPYQESDRSGQLRYAWFKTDGQTKVLLSLVFAESDEQAAEALAGQLGRPTGVAWCVQSAQGNVLRGESVQRLSGEAVLTVNVAESAIVVGPLGFLQPNPTVAALAYGDLVATADGTTVSGAIALDLFAGAGATTAQLRRHFDRVIPCELYPESAEQLGVEPEPAEQLLARLLEGERGPPEVDLCVANPPRAGLGPRLCSLLNTLGARRLHLMSCSPAALKRDLERLVPPVGRYRVLLSRGYDTLPQTPHVELVTWLEVTTS